MALGDRKIDVLAKDANTPPAADVATHNLLAIATRLADEARAMSLISAIQHSP